MPTGWNVDYVGPDAVEVEIGMRWTALWRLAARPWVPAAFLGMVRPSANRGLRRTGLRMTRSWAGARAGVGRPAGARRVARRLRAGHAGAWSRFAREADGTAAWGIWHRCAPATEADYRCASHAIR